MVDKGWQYLGVIGILTSIMLMVCLMIPKPQAAPEEQQGAFHPQSLVAAVNETLGLKIPVAEAFGPGCMITDVGESCTSGCTQWTDLSQECTSDCTWKYKWAMTISHSTNTTRVEYKLEYVTDDTCPPMGSPTILTSGSCTLVGLGWFASGTHSVFWLCDSCILVKMSYRRWIAPGGVGPGTPGPWISIAHSEKMCEDECP